MSSSNSYLEDLFSTEVMRWRYSKALGLSLLMQSLISTFLCNALNILIFEGSWNPMIWISYFVYGIMKPTWIAYLLLPILAYIILIRIHIRSYTVYWWVPDKRLQYVTHILRFEKLFYSFLLVTVCSLLVQNYAYLVNSKFVLLTLPCSYSSEDHCVNHQAIIILFAGITFGCRLSYKYFVNNYGVIQFPAAETNYGVKLRSKLKIRTIIEACALFDVGLWLIISIISCYVLLAMSNFINTIVHSPLENSNVLDALYMIFDVRQLLTLTFCLVLLAFNIHCFFLIFNDIITKRIEIPISTNELTDNAAQISQNCNAWTLSNALVSSCSLLQLLAFKQLKDFSEDATSLGSFYRDEIFTISQPGGHPRNWQGVLNPSLNLIRKFTEKLKINNCLEDNNVPTFSTHSVIDSNKNFTKSSKSGIQQKLSDVFQILKQYPFFCYLLSDLPDSKNRQIFSEAQPVIWAIQGLSNLVSASYTDDRYGVVQRNVGDILTALIQLQQILDKVGRGIPTRRACMGTNFGSKSQKYPLDLQLRRAIRLTLKSSLYSITNTFKDSIRDITLNEDVRTKMESYLAFEEG